jgi:hypothetical protein
MVSQIVFLWPVEAVAATASLHAEAAMAVSLQVPPAPLAQTPSLLAVEERPLLAELLGPVVLPQAE